MIFDSNSRTVQGDLLMELMKERPPLMTALPLQMMIIALLIFHQSWKMMSKLVLSHQMLYY